MNYYLDTEFDGHNGALLSIALVAENDASIHIRTDNRAADPWVQQNVEPLMGEHNASISITNVPENGIGADLLRFLDLTGRDGPPTIIADSVVDIARFCRAVSTDTDGGWASVDLPLMLFAVYDVAAYPTTLEGAVPHNAWWDAMALREKLRDAD